MDREKRAKQRGFRARFGIGKEAAFVKAGRRQTAPPAISPNRESAIEAAFENAIQRRFANLAFGMLRARLVLGVGACMVVIFVEDRGVGD